MKKGLRHDQVCPFTHRVLFERGPDEEGIETVRASAELVVSVRSNADLMKKGLRPDRSDQHPNFKLFERGPDEEGIETIAHLQMLLFAVRTRT